MATHLSLKLGKLPLISGKGIKHWEEQRMMGTGGEGPSEIGSGTYMQQLASCASVSQASEKRPKTAYLPGPFFNCYFQQLWFTASISKVRPAGAGRDGGFLVLSTGFLAAASKASLVIGPFSHMGAAVAVRRWAEESGCHSWSLPQLEPPTAGASLEHPEAHCPPSGMLCLKGSFFSFDRKKNGPGESD